VIYLSVLNRLVLDSLPFRREESILKINTCFSNQIITEKIIVIINFKVERTTSREGSFKIIAFVKVRIGFI
jgi:hypothetical protein